MRGLSVVLSRLGIAAEETMAFGDWFNDEAMLDGVGFPVIMRNAARDLHKPGYFITDSNDHDGIFRALVHFGLIKG
jgi:hydroxymethylpyrimidine pyrophosphatase-like HAD family hydrolase